MVDSVELDGARFAVTLEPDADMGPPWENEDGHGPVSDWRRHAFGQGTKPPKAPGERILAWDQGHYRTYDFREACKVALRDGWGAPGDAGMTRRQKAAHAAEADFQRLRAWCADQWCYVGVVVELLGDDGHGTGDTASLWGMESDADEYIDETARELASDILYNLAQRGAPASAMGD